MSCPGLYCGRILLENGKLSDCGSCPLGYRRNATTFICEPCLSSPGLYDWFFNFYAPMCHFSFSKNVLVLHASAFFEVLISCLLAVLSLSPIGEFTIYSCHSKSLSDWYTLLHNPTPDYGDKVYCTQEAVYPLGINYSFPYLLLVISVISCAAHFAVRMEQNIPALIRSTITQPRNIVIVLGHWCLHAYGIISLTQLDKPLMHGLLLLLQKTVFKKTKDDSGNYVFTYIFEHNVTSGGLRRHLSRYQGPGRRGRRPLVPRSPTTDAGGKTLMETEDCRTENFFLYDLPSLEPVTISGAPQFALCPATPSIEFITAFSRCSFKTIIVDQYSLQEIRNNVLLSLNEQLCHIEDNLELQNGDEIAVIPPLSGG
ncbi:hypothetical protein HUJ05_013100 [Dendroctonus ponderosae]|nr:hypothetical protein HUJ05_013100 [Dendroctonus ponderosae]